MGTDGTDGRPDVAAPTGSTLAEPAPQAGVDAHAIIPRQRRSPGRLPAAPRRLPRARYRIRSRIRIGLAVGAVVFLLLVAWIALRSLSARNAAMAADADFAALRTAVAGGSSDVAAARSQDLRRHAARAVELTGDPAFALTEHLPLIGPSFRTARGVMLAADEIARTSVPPLLSATRGLDGPGLVSGDGSLDPAALVRAQQPVADALPGIDDALRRVQRLPTRHVVAPLRDERTSLLSDLTGLSRGLHDADLALRLGPVMLGAEQPRSYLVTVQDDARFRRTGDRIGVYAVLDVDRGRMWLDSVGSEDDLFPAAGDLAVTAGSGTGPGPADFPTAAARLTATFQRTHGQHLDGVLALDPTALSYLLELAGPVLTADGTQVDASNLAQLSQVDAYARYPDEAARKRFVTGLTQVVLDHVLDRILQVPVADTVSALTRAVDERRLALASSSTAEQRQLDPVAVGGR